MTVGDRLRDARKAAGLTQDKLAAKSGVPVGTISRIESGATTDPELRTLRQLAAAMGIDYAALIARGDEGTVGGIAGPRVGDVSGPAYSSSTAAGLVHDGNAEWVHQRNRALRLAGFQDGTARWDLVVTRIDGARGRDGASLELVLEMIDILRREEEELGLDPEVAEARARRELERKRLEATGYRMQPVPPPPLALKPGSDDDPPRPPKGEKPTRPGRKR